ncbi:hypothetical protein NP233_g5851 [Leucocoprinus birnbaumii]|uniref:Major facilitator superfamily (MFS) profile domain-containing protein n=1 Tax=Leucocoprinus birnbaumii TaxID=56174 RepID=A0AAD5YWA6_9AGAR|nr:hypothetical protein NP233_g5851 [Leucocoprinus birnbaumii]
MPTTDTGRVDDEQTPLLASPSTEAQEPQPTPLPKLQVGVVLFLQLCEPITGFSIYPYINELVSKLDIVGGDQRKVGYYAGLIESLFFATEALTVLQWGRLSDYIGRKPVLLTGLIGSSISMLCFGLSKTFWTLVISRCLCGLLNGNIGVMKSVMGELTDSSNRAKAVALMPVVWSTGASLGPLLGGALSNPHKRLPTVFRAPFWEEHPYFLSCSAASSFVFVAIIITAVFFKETLPRRKQGTSSSNTTSSDAPPPIREILVWPVIISVANYVALAFLEIMLNSLLPLFLAMPVEIGGLGFSPPTIGYLWGGYAAATGLYNILFFAWILRRLGEKRVFATGIILFVPVFILMPAMNMCARVWGVGALVWSLVILEFFIMIVKNMAYGSMFIYVTASAPNKRSLGATNGLSQMAVSVSRAIGPALSTSLFSYSVQNNFLGGYGVYLLMIMFSLLAAVIASFLPMRAWEEKEVSSE